MNNSQQTIKILSNISKASLIFLQPISIENTYSIIVKQAINLVKADHGSIILRQKRDLKRVYSTLPIAYTVKIRRRGYTYRALRKNQLLVQNWKQVKKWHPEIEKIGIKSNVFIPLSWRMQSIGILIVNSIKENHFKQLEIDALKLFGTMASLAIRKAQLAEEAERALASRNLFISMAAHEFRTPITTINGYAQLLHKKLSNRNLPEVKWTKELWWESNRLNLLVNELLEASRIKQDNFHYNLKEHSLNRLINKAVLNFQFIHPDRQLIVKNYLAKGQDIIIADFNKILQVFTNVLDNAAKFSSPQTNINLLILFKNPYFILTVTDVGKGIAKADLKRVFEDFYRGKNAQKEGMGLGLSLVKDIIEAHKGIIKLSSKIGKGTKVQIKLFKSKKP